MSGERAGRVIALQAAAIWWSLMWCLGLLAELMFGWLLLHTGVLWLEATGYQVSQVALGGVAAFSPTVKRSAGTLAAGTAIVTVTLIVAAMSVDATGHSAASWEHRVTVGLAVAAIVVGLVTSALLATAIRARGRR
jgi:hypothetical protein